MDNKNKNTQSSIGSLVPLTPNGVDIQYAKLEENNNNTNKSLNTIDEDNANLYKIKPYDAKASTAMAINCIIGTGCFGLPYAFKEAGLLLNTILMICGSILAGISANYFIETLARMEGIHKSIEDYKKNNNNDNNTTTTNNNIIKYPEPIHQITYRKFDFVTIAEFLSGIIFKSITQIILFIYLIGALWAYATVFGSSIASYLYPFLFSNSTKSCDPAGNNPLTSCENMFFINVAIYGCIMIFLVLMGLGEQATIQKILTIYRFVAIFLMIITMIMKLATEDSSILSENIASVPMFNFSKFGKGFGPSFLALNYHFSIPDMLQPLKNKNKAQIVSISSLSISVILYLLLGILGSISFGNDVKPLVTLNWGRFTGCGSNGWTVCNDSKNSNFIGECIKALILLFPAINVASTFPLVAISLAENMFASFPPEFIKKYKEKNVKLCTRLISSIPPILLACLFKKLDMLFSIFGILGMFTSLTIPFWFQRQSILHCINVYGNNKQYYMTKYSIGFISSKRVSEILLICSFISAGIAFACI